jgi:hypothetical protein
MPPVNTGQFLNMPTITERREAAFPAVGVIAALAIWFTGMAIAAYAFDPSAVIVVAPAPTAATAIANSDGKLLTIGTGFATGTPYRSGFVRRLYRQGARFVWPSLRQGCFAAGLTR